MSEANQILCPHCGQTYSVRPEQWAQYQGRTINCTKCGNAFQVTAPTSVAPPAGAAPLTATPSALGPAPGGGVDFTAPPPTGVGTSPGSLIAPQGGYSAPLSGYAPPAGAAMPYGGYPPQARTQGNALAVVSLIFGILSFCLLPVVGSLVAIITGIMGISRTKDPRVSGKGMAITGLVLGCVGLLMVPMYVAIAIPSFSRAREQAMRIKCSANMRQIGQALILYANSNGSHYPDKLEVLVLADTTLQSNVFICPDDKKTPPDGSSAQTMAAGIASGQHTSYIYVGNGLTLSEPSDSILLYERITNHDNEGMNVLYADGHVDWVPKSQAQQIIIEAGSGQHPLKEPGTNAGP